MTQCLPLPGKGKKVLHEPLKYCIWYTRLKILSAPARILSVECAISRESIIIR